MPLFSDPSSTCPTCLLPYVYADHIGNADLLRAPHVIGCGHVFCLDCLQKIPSSEGRISPTCPLCRTPFRVSAAIRLFIDSVSSEVENSEPVSDARRKLAGFARDMSLHGVPGEQLVEQIQQFLQTVTPKRDDDRSYASAIDAMAEILGYYIESQRRVDGLNYTVSQRARAHRRSTAVSDLLTEVLMDEIISTESKLERYTAMPSVPAVRRYTGMYTSPQRTPPVDAPAPGTVAGVTYIAGPPPGQGVFPKRTRQAENREQLDIQVRKQRLEQYRAIAAYKLDKTQLEDLAEDRDSTPQAEAGPSFTDAPPPLEAFSGGLLLFSGGEGTVQRSPTPLLGQDATYFSTEAWSIPDNNTLREVESSAQELEALDLRSPPSSWSR